MTLQPGKWLERLVAAIHHAESAGAVVTWNDEIDGRQFDVTVRFNYGLHSYLTVIECKDYASKLNVEKVDAFVTKSRDVNANKAVLISSKGFQSGCFPVAERHGIQLLVLSETCDTSIPELVEWLTPGLNIFHVRFHDAASSATFELEDWGGRLRYLTEHSKVVAGEWKRTPSQLVDEWQRTNPSLCLDQENDVELQLPLGASLIEPDGDPVPVTAMRFKCVLLEVAIPRKPMPDNHVLQGSRTLVELRDAEGNVQHTARLGDLPLGFDSPVQVGQFYELPSLFNRYYCERIDGNLVTWFLVESYQHGHLVQASLRQDIKYSAHYVPVTDDRVLERLRRLLAQLRSKQRRQVP